MKNILKKDSDLVENSYVISTKGTIIPLSRLLSKLQEAYMNHQDGDEWGAWASGTTFAVLSKLNILYSRNQVKKIRKERTN